VVVAVYVQPRASRTAIAGIHDGRLKVALRAPPVDGKANVELLRYVALILEVPKRDVSMLAGATGRRKRILVKGVALAEVASRLGLSEVE
jgi:uncharacterized protein (TIGR00251 family)